MGLLKSCKEPAKRSQRALGLRFIDWTEQVHQRQIDQSGRSWVGLDYVPLRRWQLYCIQPAAWDFGQYIVLFQPFQDEPVITRFMRLDREPRSRGAAQRATHHVTNLPILFTLPRNAQLVIRSPAPAILEATQF